MNCIDMEAKNHLYQLVGRSKIHPRHDGAFYKEGAGNKDVVGFWMENELLDVGCGANTKLAGQVAAMDPMGDIDVIEKYIFAKKRFERRRIELRTRLGLLRLRIRMSKYYRETVNKRARQQHQQTPMKMLQNQLSR